MRTDVVYPRARVVQPFVLDGKKNSYLEGGGRTSYTYCRQAKGKHNVIRCNRL